MAESEHQLFQIEMQMSIFATKIIVKIVTKYQLIYDENKELEKH